MFMVRLTDVLASNMPVCDLSLLSSVYSVFVAEAA